MKLPHLANKAARSFLITTLLATPISAFAQQEQGAAPNNDELAKKLANPISSLISVPFDTAYDFGYDNDGYKITTNLQPVVPITINDDWNLIWRTILPYVYQDKVVDDDSQSGLSDTLISLFASPAEPTESGIIWGAGPAILIPTATDDKLGSENWGLGPTAVALRQTGNLTYGALVNHIWSISGEDDRKDVNASFIQPFLAVGLGDGYNVVVSSESTYDWQESQWTAPVNFLGARVFAIGNQKVQLQVGGSVFLDSPDGGPDWGLRTKLTFLFPR